MKKCVIYAFLALLISCADGYDSVISRALTELDQKIVGAIGHRREKE